jgi:hypothetical protein
MARAMATLALAGGWSGRWPARGAGSHIGKRARRAAPLARRDPANHRQLDVAGGGERGIRWKNWKMKPIRRCRMAASSSS